MTLRFLLRAAGGGPVRPLIWCIAGLLAPSALAATNLSVWAFPGRGGFLLRQPDALGNRVLDYSQVGYRAGTIPLPVVPVKVTISPVGGDDGANIQSAINAVKALPLDTNGFRGAVLLTAGEYQISNSITIDASGIVLRGEGDDLNGTILRAAGTGQRTLVVVAGAGSASTVSGTTRNITNNYVPVGARSFHVDSTTGLGVGDRVMVRRNCNTNWIVAMGMDLLCCEPDVHIWTPSEYIMDSDRVITRIEGNRITIDAPLTCAIEQRWGGGTIREYTWSGRITNVGVEDIRGVSDYVAADDENHGWVFVSFSRVEHAWARRVTSQYFGYSCVALYTGSKWVTVTDCQALDPVSIITGGRRYAFVMDDAQHCLVANCYNRKDRHLFVTQSLTIGPNVFVDGLADTAYSDAGPHHRWGTGALWDNVTVNGNNLNVQNRGNSGSGHGWAGGNEVVWNCDADGGFVVQNPPTARNWLIGSIGPIENGTMFVGPHDPGTYDSHGANVFPNSIYYAQLQNRLTVPNLQTREYWLGEINQFTNSSSTGTVVNVDATWRTQVQLLAAGAAVNGFDIVTNNQFVPFTFSYSLSATDRIIGASLALALRAATNSTNEILHLDSTNSPLTFAQLGWSSTGTGTNTTVRVLDLGDSLSLLGDGKLNLAVSDDVGIDWALLELQVAPVQALVTNSLPPKADATVRGGVNAGVNYGTNATLDIKRDSSADNQRQAYLRWNVAGYAAQLQHARVRLTPVSVGTNGLENGIALARSGSWDENGLNWNNQPGGGKRFATWIPAADQPIEFIVTPQVQAAIAGDGQLALELLSLSDVGGPGLVSYASREHPDPTRRPQLLLLYSNALPVISAVADQSMPVNTSTAPLPFTIGDPGYAVSQLTVGAASGNPTLLPLSGIVLGGTLSNRTVTLTPAANQLGTALVTLIVTNPAGLSAGSQFLLSVTNSTVAPTNQAAASGAWLADVSGNWNQPANWVGGIIATGTDFTATFGVDVTTARTVNNDSPRPLGNLVFTDANPLSPGSWVLTNQPVTLQDSNSTPVIAVSNTTATLNLAVAGSQGLTKTGDGTLVLAGPNTYGGGTTISVGSLRVTHASGLGLVSAGTTIGSDPSARLELSGDVTLAEALTLSCKQSAAGNVPAVVNISGTNTLAGTMSLTTGGSFWTFEAAGGKLRVTGTTTNTTTTNMRTIWLRGAGAGEWSSAIGDSAAGLATAIRKDDVGVWSMSGNNTSTGTVTVSNGTFNVFGTLRGAVNVFGGTLGGTGLVVAPVSLAAGAALAPGPEDGGIGMLTMNGLLTLAADSITRMELNALSLVSDRVVGLSNLIYGGTLVLSNVAGTLLAGQSFPLFQSTTASGSFTGLSPATPGPGLAWGFNPTNGTLSVLSVAPPQFTNIAPAAGGSFTLSGTGPEGAGYRIFAATNPALPFSNWTALATGAFNGGVFNFSDLQATNFPQRVYRAVTP